MAAWLPPDNQAFFCEHHVRPIQIYLDSSDYSHLTREEYAEDLAYLASLADSGQAQFRYSYITITELLHTAKEHQSLAIERAKILKRLCGDHALIHQMDLMFADCCAAYRAGAVKYPDYAYNDESQWYPMSVGESFAAFREKMCADAYKATSKMLWDQLDPWERKRLRSNAKKLFRSSSGRAEALRGTGAVFTQRFPFLKSEHAGMVEEFFAGKITSKKFANIVFRQMFDPESLTSCTVDVIEQGLTHFAWLRSGGAKLLPLLEHGREVFDRFKSIKAASGKSSKSSQVLKEFGVDQSALRTKLLNGCWEKYKSEFRKRGINHIGWKKRMFAVSEKTVVPSVDILVEVIEQYTARIMLSSDRKLLPSDVGDLFHASYIPYVQYFRADKYMSDIYQLPANKFGTRVVPTLKALVSELRAR